MYARPHPYHNLDAIDHKPLKLLTDGPDMTMVLLTIVGCWLLIIEEKSMFAILTAPGA